MIWKKNETSYERFVRKCDPKFWIVLLGVSVLFYYLF